MSVQQQEWPSGSGQAAKLFRLANAGITVRLTDRGASLVGCEVPDRHGNLADIVLQYSSPEGYRDNPSNFGAIVGRYANRIREGTFDLDGQSYQLEINNGPNCLHSGSSNYAKRAWDAEIVDNGVMFSLVSPHGDGGFPGKLNVAVTYQLTAEAELIIDYAAETDAPTVVGLTNHAYFNLAGHKSGQALGHELEIFADSVLEPDSNVLPTGTILDVAHTPFDFRERRRVDWDWNNAGGYDHCFCLREASDQHAIRPAAVLYEPNSGRVMEVETTLPGVQLYTANHLDGSPSNAGYGKHAGLCLECQQYPAAPNYEHFPGTVLRPGDRLSHRTLHRFRTEP